MTPLAKMGRLLGLRRDESRARRPRLSLDLAETVVYAVGDVHGCLDELLALEALIQRDAASLPGRKLIIMLGDYVDRGPASAQVLDHLAALPPAGFERICLAGNHEVAMLAYLDGRVTLPVWLRMGGEQTLQSYGIDYRRLKEMWGSDDEIDAVVRDAIPAEHVSLLRALPVLVDAGSYLFVHAGIRPGLALERQADVDLVFIRKDFFENADKLSRYVIHGHTPVPEARREGMRVNLDTGAYYTGRLTAMRLWQNKGRYLTNLDESA